MTTEYAFDGIGYDNRTSFHDMLTDYYRSGEDADTPQEEIDAFIDRLFQLICDSAIMGSLLVTDKPAGFVLWENADGEFSELQGRGTILEIGVVPQLRRQGLGAELVRHAEDKMCEAGVTGAYVCAYGPAERFWQSRGYIRTEHTAKNQLPIYVKELL